MRVGVLHGGLELEVEKLAVPPSQRLEIVDHNSEMHSTPSHHASPAAHSYSKNHPFAPTPALSMSSSPLDSPVSSARSSPPPQTPELASTDVSGNGLARRFGFPANKTGSDDVEELKLDDGGVDA